MTDFTYHVHRWCQTNEVDQQVVHSDNGNTYRVYYSNRNGWECSCPGFKFRKYCKHIEKAEKDKCNHGWEAACGVPSDDQVGEEHLCPKCGGPSSLVKVAA